MSHRFMLHITSQIVQVHEEDQLCQARYSEIIRDIESSCGHPGDGNHLLGIPLNTNPVS